MFKSINPFTQQVVLEIKPHTDKEAVDVIQSAQNAFLAWKNVEVNDRAALVKGLAKNLSIRKRELAELITTEMGKVIGESEAEIEKCIWLCEYYAQHANDMLASHDIQSDATSSFVRFDPLGVIYAIMPWNFPFWQVLRFAIPTIMAGNTVVLKHAPNVFGCAKAIEQLFDESDFPEGTFKNLFINVDQSELIIANPLVQGVTLTGSQGAGRIVASQAGKYLKKTVLELGGSDPFIVLADAEIDLACRTGTSSRMLNAGQVCIAAKRFIAEESIYERFVSEQKSLMEKLLPGDPMGETTDIGPMARTDLLKQVDRQVQESIRQGAKLETGGHILDKTFYAPTLLTQVKRGMPVYDEETFGPVSIVIPVKNPEEAIKVANDTSYGLGASIWTSDISLANKMAEKIESGAVFINGMTKSDPRLPFGGIKQSGYGRELSTFGIREFVNIKTVWIK